MWYVIAKIFGRIEFWQILFIEHLFSTLRVPSFADIMNSVELPFEQKISNLSISTLIERLTSADNIVGE